MKTFSDRWRQLDWDDIRLRINGKTAADVERALNASQLTRDDMMALLSPAASGYLEQLAQRAQRLTRQRFGNTVSFYVPLYLSNLCANDCTYCGFSMSNRIKRKTLDEADIARESAAIREMGFEHLLLVTGEHQAKVGMDYFRRHLPALREQFSSLQMEVQPLAETEYAELKQLGLDGVMVYQETYHEATYARHHLKGKKQDFFWRLETPDRLGRAGIDKIGLGALIGLSDNWRVDSYMVAEHLLWLQQHYWQSRYSVSFPRLRPCTGGIEPASIMDERQLVQTICAFRLLAPEIELSLSTRESPWFRDRVIPLAINNVSAFSKTQPGGYADNHPAQYLQGRMANQLLQVVVRNGLAIDKNISENRVDYLRLGSRFPPHAHGVVHHHHGDHKRQSKKAGREALPEADAHGDGAHERRMRAGHSPGFKKAPPIDPAVGGNLDNKLDQLGNKPG